MKLNIRITPVLFLFVLLSLVQLQGCKSSSTATGSKTDTKAADIAKDRKLHETFIEANKAKILGDNDKAVTLLQECLVLDPKNAAVYYELATVYNEQSHYREAYSMAEKAAMLEPSNPWYLLLYADFLEGARQYDKAAYQFSRLLKMDPNNPEYLESYAQIQVYAQHYAEAIKAYDLLEQQIGVTEQITLQKQKLYVEMGKTDKAVAEVEKLIAQDPHEAKYYTLLAETYLSAGKNDKALEVYQRAEAENPDDPYLQISLSDYYRKIGEIDKSNAMLRKAIGNPAMDLDTKIQVLLAFYSYSEKDKTIKDQAYELLDELKTLYPDEPKVNSILGDFLVRDEKYKEARIAFRQVIAVDSSRFAVWEGLMRVEAQLEDNAALASEAERASDLFPEQPGPFFFAGIANYQLKNYQKSITNFKRAEGLIVDNDGLLRDLYSFLGDAYNQVKDDANSDASYEKSLKIDPNNVYVLNNYSYFLSLRGSNLEKAEKMAHKANELSPDNQSYEDTYAWVLYRMGKFEEAEQWILKAIAKGVDDNAVILEHYGDILYKKGEKDKAQQIWEKALKAGKGSDLLERKVNEKRLIE